MYGVVDLFSGAGGMSAGFAAHPAFRVLGAADAEVGKPSAARGTLGCNASYARNIGVAPVAADLATADPGELRASMGWRGELAVLLACPPCTGFSRAVPRNHLADDARNSLVGRVADYVEAWRPEVVLMENARELVTGRFAGHLAGLAERLDQAGYDVAAATHFLTDFGLPQRRERALVVAARRGTPLRTLADVWAGWHVDPAATHVRRAIAGLPPLAAGERSAADPMHAAPRFASERARRRLAATPRDGGSWADLLAHPDADELLTPAMRRRAAAGDLGSHPDVYGRLAWDRPAATIKRECGHVGNGRYAHPEQDRLCSVREMALLNGFPRDYALAGGSLSNMYRHVGDAVPPLVSYQLAAAAAWMLGGRRPAPAEIVLAGTTLTARDIAASGPASAPVAAACARGGTAA